MCYTFILHITTMSRLTGMSCILISCQIYNFIYFLPVCSLSSHFLEAVVFLFCFCFCLFGATLCSAQGLSTDYALGSFLLDLRLYKVIGI